MSHQLRLVFANNANFVQARALAELADEKAKENPSWENHAAAGSAHTDAAVEARASGDEADYNHHVTCAELHHIACWNIVQAAKKAA